MANFGYDYGKGKNDTLFNPWITYDGNKVDGYYNAALDKSVWQNGSNAEDSRARVWRWTLDDLRARGISNPGGADPSVVREAYLNNVARLRRDIEAPDNAARGLTWQGSGFAGYDKYLATPSGTGETGQPDPKLPPAVVNPPPTKTPGTPTPTPDPTRNPDGTPKTAPATNPGLGGGSGGLSGAGSAAVADDPELAYEYMLRQMGLDPNISGYFSKFLHDKFSPLLQARLAASQVQGGGAQGGAYLDQLGGTIGGFGQNLFQQGGNFYGNMNDVAQQALHGGALDYLGGLKDQDQVKGYLDQLQTLAYAGANPLVQQSLADTIDRGYSNYKWDSLMRMNSGQQEDPYIQWLRNNAKYNKYLPV